jgi:ATP-dependent Lon protease
VIRLAGYTDLEKAEIARRHLVPRQMDMTGVTPKQLKITDRALASLIDRYTEEAGLRQLEREIGKICRKVARRVAEAQDKGERFRRVTVTPQNLHELLGPPRPRNEGTLKRDEVGVVTGLAWTAAGGEVLYIEAILYKGKGNLLLTGQLGDVMRESAQAAFSYARAHAAEFGIPEKAFEENDVHVHVPEGAVPKDGPSAGITMATALISALARRPVRRDVAMTGEITLRGHVLAIGGVKEKVLAAHREKRKKIIMPAGNRRDLDEVPPEVRDALEFHFCATVAEVLEIALVKAKKGHR